MAADKELQAELDMLKADMARLREDLGGLVGALKGAGSAKASAMKEEMGDFVEDAEEKAKKILEILKEKGKAGAHYAGDKVGEHPFIAILAAFGVGFVLAKILDRNGK